MRHVFCVLGLSVLITTAARSAEEDAGYVENYSTPLELVHRFQGMTDTIQALAFSSDGKRLAASTRDGTLRVWGLSHPTDSTVVENAQCLVLSDGWMVYKREGRSEGRVASNWLASGPYAAQRKSLAQQIGLVSIRTGEPVASWRDVGLTLDRYDRCGLSRDGRYLLGTAGLAAPCLHYASTGRLIKEFDADNSISSVRQVEFAPDGKSVAIGGGGGIVHFSVPDGKVLWKRTSEDSTLLSAIAFSPTGQMIAGVGRIDIGEQAIENDKTNIRYYAGVIWDARYGRVVSRLDLPDRPRSVAFSPDGAFLATGSDNHVSLFSVFSGRVVSEVTNEQSEVSAVAFSPHGRQLAIGLDNGTIILRHLGVSPAGAKRRVEPVDDQSLERAWWALSARSPEEVFEAEHRLVSVGPKRLVTFLKERMQPMRLRPNRAPELLDQLDDPVFAVREAAARELSLLGFSAEPALRARLQRKNVSLQLWQSITRLLEDLELSTATPEQLRYFRAIGILGRVDGGPARELLAELAQGPPEILSAHAATVQLRSMKRR